MKISPALSLSAALVVATGLVPLIGVGSAEAATPIVVTGGDVSVDGSSGWAVESSNSGTGAFVDGIASPPLGVGSYYLKSNATGDKQFLHMTKVDGVALAGRPLTDLHALCRSLASPRTACTRPTSTSPFTATSSTPTATEHR